MRLPLLGLCVVFGFLIEHVNTQRDDLVANWQINIVLTKEQDCMDSTRLRSSLATFFGDSLRGKNEKALKSVTSPCAAPLSIVYFRYSHHITWYYQVEITELSKTQPVGSERQAGTDCDSVTAGDKLPRQWRCPELACLMPLSEEE
eukprot:616156-Rhodomonas_salina.1